MAQKPTKALIPSSVSLGRSYLERGTLGESPQAGGGLCVPQASSNPTKAMTTKDSPYPFLKWVGGKRQLFAEITKRLPKSFSNYIEPFVGGGAVFFGLIDRFERAVLADNNLELVITYQVIKKEPEALINLLRQHSKNHSKENYYKVRKQEPKDPLKMAARFLYLNKTCFNGLYRVNKSGKFNAPIGSYKNPNIVQEHNIRTCNIALRKAHIVRGDFEIVRGFVRRGDFVYLDPPYHPTTETSFTAYTEHNFTEKDQVRLRDFIYELHKKGAYIMLSNSKTKLIDDLYRHRCFTKNVVMAPRFVNCKSSERGPVEEYLITNY